MSKLEFAHRYNESEMAKKYPESKFLIGQKRACATWWMGNNYRNASNYYGAYPPMYLKRIELIFPYDTFHTLHLFSGSLKKGNYVRLDSNPKMNPDVVGNAENLAECFPNFKKFDVILADPPYRDSDAEKYGCVLPNKKRVVESCYDVLKVGGHLVWLDEMMPMYRKDMWDVLGFVSIVRSTNHRFRMAVIFQKHNRKD